MAALDILSWWRSVLDLFATSAWWIFVPVIVLAIFSITVRLLLRRFC